jgi:hypothetical protein
MATIFSTGSPSPHGKSEFDNLSCEVMLETVPCIIHGAVLLPFLACLIVYACIEE